MTTHSRLTIMNLVMAMMALGAFGGVLLFISVSLYAAGFYIYDLGYWGGGVGAWVGALVSTIASLSVIRLFKKEYDKQKCRETKEDSEKESPAIIKPEN